MSASKFKTDMQGCVKCGRETPKGTESCPACGCIHPSEKKGALGCIFVPLLFISFIASLKYPILWLLFFSIIIYWGRLETKLAKAQNDSVAQFASGITEKNKYTKSNTTKRALNSDKTKSKYFGIHDFLDDLSIVWAGSPYDIEFSYKDGSGAKTRRKVTIEEIAVSNNFRPYFIGHCHLRDELRHFKMDRIASKINYKSKRYDLIEFIDIVMDLDFELVKKIDNAIAESY
ncbi:WYL domain-containing protein [Yersinia pekkanenii]|uniref:WYL domain-containing protein n=1 Tax=Yersinia pekkanenii TaxID=1288385 RepID=A0A0T9RBL5_9GAMM|nr:WYL domain-containing protein [Yersinia pekkanenii]CNI54503.1 Uncharacterised protein [Yersinia pekkanenii]CRY69403.1 Uncharacterised protein [Yersinia pekkanenii]